MDKHQTPVEGIVTSGNAGGSGWRHLKWIVPAAVVAVLLGVGAWWFSQGGHGTPKVTTVCSSKLISKGSKAINSKDFNTASQTVNQISKLAGADGDPNCVYLEASYAIMTGDSTTANQSYDRLVSLKAANQNKLTYSSAFASPPMSLPNLKATIQVIEDNSTADDTMNSRANSDLQQMDKMIQAKKHGDKQ